MRFSALGLIVFALALPARALAWTWPTHGPVLRTFSFDRAHPYAAGQRRGVDIGAGAPGEPVLTPAAGVVSFSGATPANGLTLSIRTADGFTVSLTHLGALAVRAGARRRGCARRRARLERDRGVRGALRPPRNPAYGGRKRLRRPAVALARAGDGAASAASACERDRRRAGTDAARTRTDGRRRASAGRATAFRGRLRSAGSRRLRARGRGNAGGSARDTGRRACRSAAGRGRAGAAGRTAARVVRSCDSASRREAP